jgi:hypothetical protein
MLFLICRYLIGFEYWDVGYGTRALYLNPGTFFLKLTTSLLLFALLINFFQYVKELFNPGTPVAGVLFLCFSNSTGDGGE